MNSTASYRYHALLVEDSPLDVRLVQQAIEDTKMPVELKVISDGEAAATFVQTEEMKSIDFVLLDLNLPKVNGLDILGELRRNSSVPLLPVIVYTTSHAEELVRTSYQGGANAFLHKPIDALDFMAKIEHLLRFWCLAATVPHRNDR